MRFVIGATAYIAREKQYFYDSLCCKQYFVFPN